MIYSDLHNGTHELRLDSYDSKYISPVKKVAEKPVITSTPKEVVVKVIPVIEVAPIAKPIIVNLPYLDSTGLHILAATISKVKKVVTKTIIFNYNGNVYKYDEKLKLPDNIMHRLRILLKSIIYINI